MSFLSKTILLGAVAGALGLFDVVLSAQEHDAVAPVSRDGDWWTQRHERFNRSVAERGSEVELVFIGDSITQGWEGSGAAVWNAYYEDRHALNLGIGGDRTQHVLWRLANGNLEGLSPKLAVVMIGTNNSGSERNSASEIVDGVEAIVASLRERVPDCRILLLGIFPRGAEFNDQRGQIAQVNQVLSRFPKEFSQVRYVDIGGEFLNVDGEIPKALMPDFLHLSRAGYGLWAAAIEDHVAEALGTNPREFEPAAVEGDWVFEMQGPDGLVQMRLDIERDGALLKGAISMGPDRSMEIRNGSIYRDLLSFEIERERPDGGSMKYRLVGEVDGDSIQGNVEATFDDQSVNSEWTARRSE